MKTTKAMPALLSRMLAATTALTMLMGSVSAASAGTMVIGHTTWVGYGPLYLARDLGYFDELGLKIDLRVNEDQPNSWAAQAAGEMDGTTSTIDGVLEYRSPAFCFKSVLALDESYGGDGVVVEDGIKTMKDVVGKEVALNEGSASQFLFAYLLKKEGLTEKDVSIVPMTADDAAAAFIAKRVPVAVTWEPNLTFIRSKAVGSLLADSTATPGLIVDVVELSCSYIEKHPDDVKALVAGYYKAVDYIKSNPEKAYEIMAKGVGGYLSNPKDFAEAVKGVRFYDKPMNVAYFGTAEKFGQIADTVAFGNEIWGGLGRLKNGNVPAADVVDPGFVGQ